MEIVVNVVLAILPYAGIIFLFLAVFKWHLKNGQGGHLFSLSWNILFNSSSVDLEELPIHGFYPKWLVFLDLITFILLSIGFISSILAIFDWKWANFFQIGYFVLILLCDSLGGAFIWKALQSKESPNAPIYLRIRLAYFLMAIFFCWLIAKSIYHGISSILIVVSHLCWNFYCVIIPKSGDIWLIHHCNQADPPAMVHRAGTRSSAGNSSGNETNVPVNALPISNQNSNQGSRPDPSSAHDSTISINSKDPSNTSELIKTRIHAVRAHSRPFEAGPDNSSNVATSSTTGGPTSLSVDEFKHRPSVGSLQSQMKKGQTITITEESKTNTGTIKSIARALSGSKKRDGKPLADTDQLNIPAQRTEE